MKLLVFTENYARGGGNRYMVDLVNSIARDYSQVVFMSNPGGIYPEDLARMEVSWLQATAGIVTRASREARWQGRLGAALAKLLLTLLEPLFMLWNVLVLWRAFGREAPDRVMVCNGGYPGAQACLAAVIAARLLRCPAWLTIASVAAPRRRQMFWYENLLDNLVWRTSAKVVVNADAITASLLTLRGVTGSKVVVIRNGMDMRPPCLGQRECVNPSVVIGCVARMDVMKGVLVLLDAFVALVKANPQVRLVLAGEGDASALLREKIALTGLADRVTMLGHFSGDVHELLASFDIFAFPSLWEGFPYSVVEAMRAGCAIVATHVGGIPEAISHEREGLLIKPGDGEGLLAALNRLVNDLDLRRNLSERARRRFEQEFTLEKMHWHGRRVLMGDL